VTATVETLCSKAAYGKVASCFSPLCKLLCDASGDLQQSAARSKRDSMTCECLVGMLR